MIQTRERGQTAAIQRLEPRGWAMDLSRLPTGWIRGSPPTSISACRSPRATPWFTPALWKSRSWYFGRAATDSLAQPSRRPPIRTGMGWIIKRNFQPERTRPMRIPTAMPCPMAGKWALPWIRWRPTPCPMRMPMAARISTSFPWAAIRPIRWMPGSYLSISLRTWVEPTGWTMSTPAEPTRWLWN